jgi:nucleotide-binding universal stress UspA family protein
MTSTIIVAVDGSDLALEAAREGLSLVRPPDRVVVAVVSHAPDPALASDGSGHAGPSMSESELIEQRERATQEGFAVLGAATAHLQADLTGVSVETRVLEGHPGKALCRLAEDEGAVALVLGSRGRGGFKRALLGSVSDHVVRHATCPVVVVNPAATPKHKH